MTNNYRYYTEIIRINIDTGEIINNYIINIDKLELIKTSKEIYNGKYTGTKIIRYTKLYRIKQQLEFEFKNK